ncbi:hypothetical protein WNY37_14720 [Henriciella sp. AS95]|uniref:hypothetical protein n=1 Tax=Henriciella sp. AS95 TaxID=3135782 RepID=UPI0031785213
MVKSVELQDLEERRRGFLTLAIVSFIALAATLLFAIQYFHTNNAPEFSGIHVPDRAAAAIPGLRQYDQTLDLSLLDRAKLASSAVLKITYLLLLPALLFALYKRRWLLCLILVGIFTAILLVSDLSTAALAQPKTFVGDDVAREVSGLLEEDGRFPTEQAYIDLQLARNATIPETVVGSIASREIDALQSRVLYDRTGFSDLPAGCSTNGCWTFRQSQNGAMASAIIVLGFLISALVSCLMIFVLARHIVQIETLGTPQSPSMGS